MAQTAPRPPATSQDWTVQAADRIEAVVEVVRDKTTVPAQKVATAIVYGIVAAVMGLLALVLFVIALLRLHVYLPFDPEGRRVWVTYMVLGAIFILVGVFLWRKRTPSKMRDKS
jgi:hypothetical protein